MKRPPSNRTCLYCGKEFAPAYRWQNYCSRECGSRARAAKLLGRVKKHDTRICVQCGREYTPSGNRQLRCDECRNIAKKKDQKICMQCGREFMPRDWRQKYCCHECGYEAKRIARIIAGNIPEIIISCLYCGKKVVTTHERRKFCSEKCRLAYYEQERRRKQNAQNKKDKLASFKLRVACKGLVKIEDVRFGMMYYCDMLCLKSLQVPCEFCEWHRAPEEIKPELWEEI